MTALKTVSLRLRGTKVELEDLGEETDGMVETTSALRDLLLELTGGKVDIQLDVDTYKSTYDIMLEMSRVWKDMTDMQQASALEAMFGKRQANIGASIISNMSEATNALETSLNSSGSAMRENEKYLESIDGKLKQLSASFEELSNTTLNSGALKFLIDFARMLVQATNAVGGLLPVLLTLTGLFLTFAKNEKFTKIQNFIGGLFGLEAVTKTSTISIMGLNMSLRAFMVTVSLGLTLLPLLFSLLSEYIPTLEKQREKVAQATTEYENLASEITSLNDELSNTSFRIEELQALADNGTISLTEQEELDRLKLVNAELQRELEIKKALEEVKRKQLSEDTINLIGRKTEQSIISTPDETSSVSTNITKQEAIGERIAEYNRLSTVIDDLKNKQQELGEITEKNEGQWNNLQKQIDENVKIQDEYKEYINQTSLDLIEYGKNIDTTTEEGKKYKSLIDAIIVAVEDFNSAQKDNTVITNENSKAIKDVATGIESIDISKITSKLEVLNSAQKEFKKEGELTNSTLKNIADTFPVLKKSILEYQLGLKTSKDIINELAKAYDEDKTAFEVANRDKIIFTEEFYNTHVLKNQSLVKQLKSLYGQDYNNFAKLAQDKAKIDANLMTVLGENWTRFYSSMGKAIRATIKIGGGADKTSHEWAARGLGSFEEWKEYKANKEKARQELQTMLPVADMYDQIASNFKFTPSNLNNVDVSKSDGNGKSSGSSAKSTTDTWLEEFNKLYAELKHRRTMDLIDDKQYYDELKALDTKYFGDNAKYINEHRKNLEELYGLRKTISEDYINDKEHEIFLLSKVDNTEQERIHIYKKMQDEVHNMAEEARRRGLKDTDEYLQNLSKKWWSYADEISSIIDSLKDKAEKRYQGAQRAATNQINSEIESLNERLEKDNEYYDKHIQKLQEEKDAISKVADEQKRLFDIEQAREALAKAKQSKIQIYKEGQGLVWNTDVTKVGEAQDHLDSLLADWDKYQKELSLDEQIKSFQNAKEENEKTIKAQIKNLDKLKDAWSDALNIDDEVNAYKGNLRDLVGSENASFEERLALVRSFVSNYNAEMSRINNQVFESDIREQMKRNSEAWHTAGTQEEKDRLHAENERLASQIGDTYNSSSGTWSSGSSSGGSSSGGTIVGNVVNKIKDTVGSIFKGLKGHADGTFSATEGWAITQEYGNELIVPKPSQGRYTYLSDGDGVIPADITERLMKLGIDPISYIGNAIRNFGIPKINSSSKNKEVEFVFEGDIVLPNVNNAEEFGKEIMRFSSTKMKQILD